MKRSLRDQFKACSKKQIELAMIEVENHFSNSDNEEDIRQLMAWRKLARKQLAFLDRKKRNARVKKKGVLLIKKQ